MRKRSATSNLLVFMLMVLNCVSVYAETDVSSDNIINLYLSHSGYYIAIYSLIIVVVVFNLFFQSYLCKAEKYLIAFLVNVQSLILDIALLLFSICNVVVLDQWVNTEIYNVDKGYGNLFVILTGVAFGVTLVSSIMFITSYFKNKK